MQLMLRYQDPFEDYKARLARKLAHQSAQPHSQKQEDKGDKDEVNWFGVKVDGSNHSATKEATGHVGKYVSLKRSAVETPESVSSTARGEEKKKRKVGFGSFDSW